MADNGEIMKIWGFRKRLLLSKSSEIDLVTLSKDCFCSTHHHKKKINKFVVVSGLVRIETEYGQADLGAGQSIEVRPPLIHRFLALEDSVMIELAYVEVGEIDADDIVRKSQGGKRVEVEVGDKNEKGSIESMEMTLDELREEGLLDL